MGRTDSGLRYRAFLSYSHRDERAAARLHRWLETFRVPKNLRGADAAHGPLPPRLQPVFRDRDELASAAALSASLEAALDESAALIVVCSPAAVASKWVGEEIRRFRTRHPDRPVLAYVVDGDPGLDPRAAPERAALPLHLLLADADDPQSPLGEPIAADARHAGDGERAARLKLAAALLGVRFDELRRRDFRRRQRTLAIAGSGALALAAVFAYLAWSATLARDEARRQRDRAELELRSERQTRGFLLSVFQLADAGEARGNSVTVREVLDRAVERIDATEFARPAIKSRYLATLGQAYSSLGLTKRSVELLRASLDAAAGEARELAEQRVDSGIELADVLYAMGDYVAAQAALDAALAAADRVDAARQARAANVRGDVLARTGRAADARRAYRRAIELVRAAAPDAEDSVLIRARARSGLAYLDFDAGDHAGADAHFAAALAALTTTVGERHPLAISALNSRAANAYARRDYAAARRYWAQALANALAVYDADNPEIGTIKNNLGRLLLESGDVAAAETLLREALASDRKHRSAGFDDLAFSLHNLAYARWAAGDATEARALLDEALPIAEATDHRMLAPILNALADVRCASGDHAEGSALAARAADLAAARHGADHWTVQQAALTRAYCEAAARRGASDAARRAAAQAAAAVEARFGTASAFAARARAQLAAVRARP